MYTMTCSINSVVPFLIPPTPLPDHASWLPGTTRFARGVVLRTPCSTTTRPLTYSTSQFCTPAHPSRPFPQSPCAAQILKTRHFRITVMPPTRARATKMYWYLVYGRTIDDGCSGKTRPRSPAERPAPRRSQEWRPPGSPSFKAL